MAGWAGGWVTGWEVGWNLIIKTISDELDCAELGNVPKREADQSL